MFSNQSKAIANPTLLEDAQAGLRQIPKSLPCKWFYDTEGSRLFELISQLPEYYVNRLEKNILLEHAVDIATIVGVGSSLFDFGPGDGRKAGIILKALRQPKLYVPVDMSDGWINIINKNIGEDSPGCPIIHVRADFSSTVSVPQELISSPMLGLLLGTTIGNFTPSAAVSLLASLKKSFCIPMRLLIGVDLVKEQHILELAYDDPNGVTAQFNLNILARLNRELLADFDLSRFKHRALWNKRAQKVDLFLESLCRQQVTIDGEQFSFDFGERIHTEDSYKFTQQSFSDLCIKAGWCVEETWFDSEEWYSLWMIRSN